MKYFKKHIISQCLCVSSVLPIVVLFLTFSCATKEPEVIKIGAILPLTGDFSSHGQDAKKGIEVAIEQENSKGGIGGKKISVIYEDDRMLPANGVSAFRKLTTIDRVQAIVGGIGSSVALAIAPIAEEERVVLISPTASNPKLTEAGDYFFRVWPSDLYEGNVMADFVYNSGMQRLAILYINNDFGQGLREVFRNRFRENGGQILIEEVYDQGATDFRAQLSKIKVEYPEGIYLPGYYQEVAKIAVQNSEIGIKAKLFSTSPIENLVLIKLAGKAAENIIYTRPVFDPKNPSEKYKNFSIAFKQKHNTDPGIAAAFSYDAIGVILHSISKINTQGSLTRENIQKEMADIRDYPGVTGIFSFDQNGDVRREITIFTIRNGQFVPIGKDQTNAG